MLAASLAGFFSGMCLALPLILTAAIQVSGLVEGIIYLTKSDEIATKGENHCFILCPVIHASFRFMSLTAVHEITGVAHYMHTNNLEWS